jgi:hypothetical protein
MGQLGAEGCSVWGRALAVMKWLKVDCAVGFGVEADMQCFAR